MPPVAPRPSTTARLPGGGRTRLLVLALILGLSAATVYAQFRGLIAIAPGGDPHDFVNRLQVARTEGTLHGLLGDPWRYRVGSEALAWVALKAARAAGFGEPGVVGFLSFRVLQNAAIFGLSWLLYRRLGASRYVAAFGLALVAWALTQSLYHSGLAFDTYGEVIVYLAAGVLILDRRYAWIVPLTIVGTINREECGLVALMLMAVAIPLGPRTREGRRVLLLGGAALVAWAATYGIVRLIVGPGELILPYGKHIGLEILQFNVTHGVTWENLFRTWTIVPLLALWQWRRWPRTLQLFGIAVVPIWLTVHFFAALVAETRLMLVPFVLVFVPGALCGLRERREAAAA